MILSQNFKENDYLGVYSYLARSLFVRHEYFNFDLEEHRVRLQEKTWDDSLAGRFFSFRLHPLDLKEMKNLTPLASWNETEVFHRLLVRGGFPEPFLEVQQEFWHQRWRRSHLDIILRQDLLHLEAVHSIAGLATLIALLRERVGSTVSYSSLARDLQKDPKTVKRWLEILENLYVLFRVTNYNWNISRSLLKEPKFYFYDNGQVVGGQGNQFFNHSSTGSEASD